MALRQAQEPAHRKCECEGESEGDEGDSNITETELMT